jgi:hypothetical protein
MENDYKIKALDKLLNKLVIPKVNKLEEHTGFKILHLEVEGTDFSEGYNEHYYIVNVTISDDNEYRSFGGLVDLYNGVSNLLSNTSEYIITTGFLYIYYHKDGKHGKHYYEWEVAPDDNHISDEDCLDLILFAE